MSAQFLIKAMTTEISILSHYNYFYTFINSFKMRIQMALNIIIEHYLAKC